MHCWRRNAFAEGGASGSLFCDGIRPPKPLEAGGLQVEQEASFGYPPTLNARRAADCVDSLNRLKGNWLCQRLRSPCAVSSSPLSASALPRLLPRGRTSWPSIPTPVSACLAVPWRSRGRRPLIRSSTRSAPPAGRRSIRGRETLAPSPPTPLPGASWPAASWLAASWPATWRPSPRAPCMPSTPAAICPRLRPARSRVESWLFRSWVR